MKHTNLFKTVLCLVLVVLLAAAVTLTGCSKQEKAPDGVSPAVDGINDATAADLGQSTELGKGAKVFYFDVTFSDGSTASYVIHTDAETVGTALLDNNLIDGTPSDYGLYVTTVDGQMLDYDADHMYWAFYENGEYASTGVDTTPIVDSTVYSFVATAG